MVTTATQYLPARHIQKADPSGSWCLRKPDCCEQMRAENGAVCDRIDEVVAARMSGIDD